MLQVDEADVHEGLRTHFPLSFGKQEAKSVSLETIHSKTKRVQPTVNNSSLVSTGNAACIFFVMKFSACQLVAGCWQLLYEGRLNRIALLGFFFIFLVLMDFLAILCYVATPLGYFGRVGIPHFVSGLSGPEYCLHIF